MEILLPFYIDIESNDSVDKIIKELQKDNYKINKDNFTLLINNNIINFDLVFMMIHGNPGENGVLQKYFENLGIHFTGPNSKTAELTFNKKKCIDYLASFSIKTARSFLLKKEENYNLKDIIRDLNFPMFIKANNSGSSLGVYKAYHEKDAKKYIKNIFKIDNEIIIERFINGREYSVGIINNGGEIQALGVTELISENDFFDYEAKYEGKHKDFTPAKIDMKLEYMLKNQAEEIYRILKIPGFSRIDFIVESNITYFLEINTIPGMTNQSIFPKQVELKNIKLKDLFTEIIQNKLK